MHFSTPPEHDPDLRLGGLSLWIRDRQFPDSADYWDANWLVAHARMETKGARVEVEGAFLHGSEIASFVQSLDGVNQALTGEAELCWIEPELKVVLRMDALGRLAVTVDITPDQLTQSHRFDFDLDQTYLSPLLASCRAILKKFPLIGCERGE